jgi:hypothetical protein
MTARRARVERARRGNVAQVEVAVDRAAQRLLVAVEHRPVDEEQPRHGARSARRLPEVGDTSLLKRREAVSLRKIHVPEDVVLEERTARPDDDENVHALRL